MANFKNIQDALQEARGNQKGSENALLLAKEQLKKLKREKDRVFRSSATNSSEYSELENREAVLNSKIAEQEALLQNAFLETTNILDQFEVFSDPRTNISQCSDSAPIMLFPVRMETRFKKVESGARGVRHQLWVRIFPDDCSIDTFENVLSIAEVERARKYWMATWSAGQSNEEGLRAFIQNKKKGAWKGLLSNMQAGRAYWITQNYVPKNTEDEPERLSESDVILVIPTETLPDAATQAALRDYWTKVWLANKDAVATTAAFDEIQAVLALDTAQTQEMVKSFVPYNFKESSPPLTAPMPAIKVVFVNFESSDQQVSKTSAWSQAARITSLPDKFVLIGHKGKDEDGQPIEVMSELGRPIPDPLIVGPNPSLDTTKVLKSAMASLFLALPTEESKNEKLKEYYDNFKDEVTTDLTFQEFFDDFITAVDAADVVAKLEYVFDNLKDEIKAAEYIKYLSQQSETKWLFDFEAAVDLGMGFKVDLSPDVYQAGFDRLFVLGIKLSADAQEGKRLIEDLFAHHHYGNTGFSIMAQGTATNNTEDEGTNYSENEDVDETFSRYILQPQEDDPDSVEFRKDGKWLSTLLGIDPEKASLYRAKNYYHTDQRESRAMNTALWSGTLGYFMESMMGPVFSKREEEVAHMFFTNFVKGRGNIPVIRIGDQPYGILATNTISNQNWLYQDGRQNILSTSSYSEELPTLQQMGQVLKKIKEDFMEFSASAAYVGKEGDPHEILLEAIGLHASSVELHQRYAKSFAHLYNLWFFYLTPSLYNIYTSEGYENRGLELLSSLGYAHSKKKEEIPILQKFFLSSSNLLKGDLIDDKPLSETNKIRGYAAPETVGDPSLNYIEWLIQNALSDHDKIKKQEGFTDNQPSALLYQMLRHAVELEFSNTALNLFQESNQLTANHVKMAKVDVDFIGIKDNVTTIESKYDYLSAQIDNSGISAARQISDTLQAGIQSFNTKRLFGIVEALKLLKDVPTARLERVFMEHLDSCTYRLDAWLLGLVNMQLEAMRKQEGAHGNEPITTGTYIGAFGWVEALKADEEVLSPANLPENLQNVFDPDGLNDIVKDNLNAGYVHAPSINQATTAAVLRNAYISNSASDNPEIYKVNLSSERVRMAHGVIEGMQQGQSLGALLGYQLERGLHDRYQEEEMDSFIYELRKAFPLVANRMKDTQQEAENFDSITQMEARNVVDGLALVNHILQATAASDKVYPFGKNLTPANSDQSKIINSEVDRVLNINDALADLATADGIHHAVQANYSRASATLDTYSKGSFPPTPEVTKTPRSGVGLTNRVGLHLNSSAVAGVGANPREIAEPGINSFLSDFFPAMADVACCVSYHTPSYIDGVDNPTHEVEINMQEMGLSAIDLLYLMDVGSDKNLSALDDYILKFLHELKAPRPDATVEIKYTQTVAGKTSVFELAPLVANMRTLLLASRPLKSSDIVLPNEGNEGVDVFGSIDLNRLTSAFNTYKDNFLDSTNPSLGMDITQDPIINLILEDDFEQTFELNKVEIISKIDAYAAAFIGRMHSLNQFGIPQSGFGFLYDRKSDIYESVYKKVMALKQRWEEKKLKYDAILLGAGAMASDDEKLEALKKAERVIATSYTTLLSPPPDTLSDFDVMLAAKRVDFDDKLGEIETWLNGNHISFLALFDAVNQLKTGVGSITGKPLSDFDLIELDWEEEERQIVVLAEDMKVQAIQMYQVLVETTENVNGLLDEHELEVSSEKQIKLLTSIGEAMFGADFKLIPSFQLSSVQAGEIDNCIAKKDQLLDYQHTLGSDFPVDDWLYGVGRVRDKMRQWESAVILSEGFDQPDKDLTPLQFPFVENDSWLGLSYPEEHEIESDKLLYTAFLNGFNGASTLCGLLIDEWTEVIPAKKETTGLTFQYDQPNAEPPQSILLVTPSSFTGQWEWKEVVDTMHETLDLGRLRAVEPKHIDPTAYAQFLPATVSAVTSSPLITIALNYAINNGLNSTLNTDDNG